MLQKFSRCGIQMSESPTSSLFPLLHPNLPHLQSPSLCRSEIALTKGPIKMIIASLKRTSRVHNSNCQRTELSELKKKMEERGRDVQGKRGHYRGSGITSLSTKVRVFSEISRHIKPSFPVHHADFSANSNSRPDFASFNGTHLIFC
jgi:hypothetical protein